MAGEKETARGSQEVADAVGPGLLELRDLFRIVIGHEGLFRSDGQETVAPDFRINQVSVVDRGVG